MALKVKAKVKDCHLPKKVRENIAEYLKYNNGKDIDIEIKRSSKVTQSQYGYLYAVVYPVIASWLTETQGQIFDVYDVDDMMKIKFHNLKSIDIDTGEVHTIPNSKTKMNKGLMMQFIDNIINWCNDKDLIIPEPYNPNLEYDYVFTESDVNN
jgi:hypothetical protein